MPTYEFIFEVITDKGRPSKKKISVFAPSPADGEPEARDKIAETHKNAKLIDINQAYGVADFS